MAQVGDIYINSKTNSKLVIIKCYSGYYLAIELGEKYDETYTINEYKLNQYYNKILPKSMPNNEINKILNKLTDHKKGSSSLIKSCLDKSITAIINETNDYNNHTSFENKKLLTKENKMENANLNILTQNPIKKLDEIKNELTELNDIVNEIAEENIKLKDEVEKQKLNFNIGNIQALKVFQNIKDFTSQTLELYNVHRWIIAEGTYEARANNLKKFSYYTKLKDEFNGKNLTNKPITDEQLVSLFDTMCIMYKVLTKITDEKIKQEMKIIMEYVIPEPSRPRIDYMLVFRNSIYLLEFSKASDIQNLSNEQTKKLQQVNGYASMLKSNVNNNNIEINSAVGMYLDDSSEANIQLTNKTIDDIKKKINKTFKNEQLKNAFELLTELE